MSSWGDSDVGDIRIGHQHHYTLECDVGDRFVIMDT